MSRRGGSARFRCAEDGCPEAALYDYSSQKEYARLAQQQQARPWRCQRHKDPEALLTPQHRTVTATLVATPGNGIIADKLFWHDGRTLGSGFEHGPGFKAFAGDFPPGTRLVITATIELPEPEPDGAA